MNEMVGSYLKAQERTNDTLKAIQGENAKVRARFDHMEGLIKRMQLTVTDSEAFGKRLGYMEETIANSERRAAKSNDNLKDYVAKTKDMLEARVDQVSAVDERMAAVKEELLKNRVMHEQYRRKIIEELERTNGEIATVKGDLAGHMESYMTTFTNNGFFMEQTQSQLKTVAKSLDTLRAYVDGRVEALEFDCSRRVRIDDMKQNFRQLNDILVIKFKQLEDTKEATRNLITFQKFFHPIQTQ